jgi:hypothetical protein
LFEGDKPIGVLNIHSDVTNLLGEKAATIFAPLISPFLILLAVFLMPLKDRAIEDFLS